ncbi:CBS domain-containing protein [Pseudomonadota bacterium]
MSMKNTLKEIHSNKNPDIHTLSPNHSVSDAVDKMKNRSIGALVILGNDNSVDGIFSERDLLNRVIGSDLDPKTTKISEVMTPSPICVDTSMTVEEAMRMVTDKRIRHLPLVSDGKLQGLISSRDLTAWVANTQESEIDELNKKLISAEAKNKGMIATVIGVCVLLVIYAVVN